MLKESGLEEELRKWRADRARKSDGLRTSSSERRTVRVNGNEVVIMRKPKRAASLS